MGKRLEECRFRKGKERKSVVLNLSLFASLPLSRSLSLGLASLLLFTSLARALALIGDLRSEQREQRLPSEPVFSETQLPDESAGEPSPSFDSV